MGHTGRWVKVAVYEKPEFLKLPWQTRALYRLIAPLLGLDGRLYVGADPVAGLAVLIRAPAEEIRQGFVDLVENGFLHVENKDTIFDSTFAETNRRLAAEPSKRKNSASIDIEVEVDIEKEKKHPGRPPGDQRHRPFIDKFFDLWGQLRGGKYEVQPKDAKAVSRFLKSHPGVTLEEWERRIRLAFADRWFAQNGNLATFIPRWVNYDRVVALVSQQPARREVVGFDEATGQVVYK